MGIALSFSSYASAKPVDLSIKDIQKILSKKPSSLEEFLSYLPKGYLSQYTLMKDGRGLQKASLISPRALVYGKSAETVLTFNGDPSQRMYDSIEILSFNRETNQPQYYEINFSKLPAELSPPNPQKCMGCHINSRPFWENDTWKNAFNENGDIQAERDFLTSADFIQHPRYSKLGKPLFLCDKFTCPNYVRPNRFLGSMMMNRWGKAVATTILNSEINVPEPDLIAGLACDDRDSVEKFLITAKQIFKNRFNPFSIDITKLNQFSQNGETKVTQVSLGYLAPYLPRFKNLVASKRTNSCYSIGESECWKISPYELIGLDETSSYFTKKDLKDICKEIKKGP